MGRDAGGQTRGKTLRYVTGSVVNTLDPAATGATPVATALSAAAYDRLFRFGRIAGGDGTYVFDAGRIEGELAEGFAVSPDGLAITVRLRPGAAWHDGSPVTAEDVKWSFGRAVGAEGLSRAQLATGSLTDAGQMAVLMALPMRPGIPAPTGSAPPRIAMH